MTVTCGKTSSCTIQREDFSNDSAAEGVQSATRFLLICFKIDKSPWPALLVLRPRCWWGRASQELEMKPTEHLWPSEIWITAKQLLEQPPRIRWGSSNGPGLLGSLWKEAGKGCWQPGLSQQHIHRKNTEPEQEPSVQLPKPSQGQHVLLELSNKDERNIS